MLKRHKSNLNPFSPNNSAINNHPKKRWKSQGFLDPSHAHRRCWHLCPAKTAPSVSLRAWGNAPSVWWPSAKKYWPRGMVAAIWSHWGNKLGGLLIWSWKWWGRVLATLWPLDNMSFFFLQGNISVKHCHEKLLESWSFHTKLPTWHE